VRVIGTCQRWPQERTAYKRNTSAERASNHRPYSIRFEEESRDSATGRRRSGWSGWFARLSVARVITNQHSIIRSSTNKLLTLAFISHSVHRMASSSSSSSSNFQLVINNALDAYKKRTKNDLLAHPLAAKLQSCNTPGAILAVLQQQIQGLDQSRSSDDRWTRWLDPTVNVLFAFSATLGEGVGLVRLVA